MFLVRLSTDFLPQIVVPNFLCGIVYQIKDITLNYICIQNKLSDNTQTSLLIALLHWFEHRADTAWFIV